MQVETSSLTQAPLWQGERGLPTVDVVIPVYNEAHVIAASTTTLRNHLRACLPNYRWRVVVVDNGSIDDTWTVVQQLAEANPDELAGRHMPEKGRGRALKHAWSESDADLMCYMDVDLSTSLEHIGPLLDAVRDGADLAIGSRLLDGAHTTRSLKREFISRCYNLITKASHATRVSDMQCGFKAIHSSAAHQLLSHVQDNYWFFDTELLLLAERWGFHIKEIPVTWVEDPDSRVKVVKTALDDLRGLARLHFRPPLRPGTLPRRAHPAQNG